MLLWGKPGTHAGNWVQNPKEWTVAGEATSAPRWDSPRACPQDDAALYGEAIA